jgi:hypothetical protein
MEIYCGTVGGTEYGRGIAGTKAAAGELAAYSALQHFNSIFAAGR